MAGSKEIRAGRAFVEIGIDDRVSAALDKVGKKVKAFGAGVTAVGASMAGLGAAITAPLVAATKIFATVGDELSKASQRTGVGVEALGGLKYAAEQSGAGLEDLEVAFKKMANVIVEGGATAAQSLGAIGLSVAQLAGLKPEDQFKLIADRLSRITDASTRAAIAQDLFGKSGTRLLPLISEGAKGIEALTERHKQLNLTISAADAATATQFGDALEDVWKQVKRVAFEVGKAVASALLPWAESAFRAGAAAIEWAKRNNSLLITIAGIGSALLAAGTAVVVLGSEIRGIGTILSAAGTIAGALGTVIGALVSPIGLAVAAIAALGAYFLFATDAGDKALTFLGQKFGELKSIASDAIGGIGDALKAGDLGLAAEILWKSLKLAFIVGTEELRKIWFSLKATILTAMTDAFYGVLKLWTNVSASLQSLWRQSAKAFQSTWQAATGAVRDYFEDNAIAVAKMTEDNRANAGLITRQQAENNKKLIDEQYQDRIKKRAQGDIAEEAAAEKQLAADLQRIEIERKAKVAALNAAETAAALAHDAAHDQAVADLNQQIADLQKQLDSLRGKAKEEAGAAGGGPARPNAPNVPDGDALAGAIARGMGTLVTPAGIFNPRALQSLVGGGGSVAERTAKASEETARNTRRLKDGGMFWA